MEKINIMVNGKDIVLTEFPSELIVSTICGMLKPLKGVNKIKNVEIKFEM